MFSLSAWNRNTVGPAMMTKPSSKKDSERLNSLRMRTPLSSPVTAEMPASSTTPAMMPSWKPGVVVSQPVTVCRPAASCSAP